MDKVPLEAMTAQERILNAQGSYIYFYYVIAEQSLKEQASTP